VLIAASYSANLLGDPPRIELRALRNKVEPSEFLGVGRNKRAPSRACWHGLRGLGSEATKCDRRKKGDTTDKSGLLHDAP
jgi:hypothetical protein